MAEFAAESFLASKLAWEGNDIRRKFAGFVSRIDDAQTKLTADAATIVANQPASKTDTSKLPALAKALEAFAKDLRTLMDGLVAAGATCFFSQACFVEGTKLLARGSWGEGFRAIELLTSADEVASRNEHDPKGEVQWKRVEEVFDRYALVKHVVLPGGHVIGTTEEHPFHDLGKGWTKANELQVGDRLICKDGTNVRLEEIHETGELRKVYNIRVADFHTYFVGDDDWGFAVWAHNACFIKGPKPLQVRTHPISEKW